MKAALLYLFAASAWAQTLTPVTAPAGSGLPWWAWPAAGVVIVVAGFVWLKFKAPATAAKVQTTVSADLQTLAVAGHRLAAAVEAHFAAAPAPTIPPGTPAAEPAVPAAVPEGKEGVPGVFTFSATVVGTSSVDIPALTAAMMTHYLRAS